VPFKLLEEPLSQTEKVLGTYKKQFLLVKQDPIHRKVPAFLLY